MMRASRMSPKRTRPLRPPHVLAAVATAVMTIVAGTAGVVVTPRAAVAQQLASRVGRVRDGTVRFSFASRPDVCGNGAGSISTRNGQTINNGYSSSRRNEWEDECEHGPVRVAMDVADGHVIAVRTYVGGRWRAPGDATDLGTVGDAEAVDYLLGPVLRDGGKGAREAIFPATIADSITTWPRLLVIARNEDLDRSTRTQAVFWVSQAAGDKVAGELRGVADDTRMDRDVRLQAVFAISQRREEGVPVLIDIAKTSKDGAVRRQAVFWLGQSHDKRALDYFESVLLKK